MADKDTVELLNRLRNTPIGDRILNYLTQRNAMPMIESTLWLNGDRGAFKEPRRGVPGQIRYVPIDPRLDANTLLHELTHAADTQISEDAMTYMNSDPRLWDAYQKLRNTSYKQGQLQPREMMAYRINPEWYQQNKGYRSSSVELPAWGVAESATPVSYVGADRAPPHLNATLAQEFDILLDLASRAKKK